MLAFVLLIFLSCCMFCDGTSTTYVSSSWKQIKKNQYLGNYSLPYSSFKIELDFVVYQFAGPQWDEIISIGNNQLDRVPSLWFNTTGKTLYFSIYIPPTYYGCDSITVDFSQVYHVRMDNIYNANNGSRYGALYVNDALSCVSQAFVSDYRLGTSRFVTSSFYPSTNASVRNVVISDCSSTYDCYPTASPTLVPTRFPTSIPSQLPTYGPTKIPTLNPTHLPSLFPTLVPSFSPIMNPTQTPSFSPVSWPTTLPTSTPSMSPTSFPTPVPTPFPTPVPTPFPTLAPTTHAPTTLTPTMFPTPDKGINVLKSTNESDKTIATTNSKTSQQAALTTNNKKYLALIIIIILIVVVAIVVLIVYRKFWMPKQKNVILLETSSNRIKNNNEGDEGFVHLKPVFAKSTDVVNIVAHSSKSSAKLDKNDIAREIEFEKKPDTLITTQQVTHQIIPEQTNDEDNIVIQLKSNNSNNINIAVTPQGQNPLDDVNNENARSEGDDDSNDDKTNVNSDDGSLDEEKKQKKGENFNQILNDVALGNDLMMDDIIDNMNDKETNLQTPL